MRKFYDAAPLHSRSGTPDKSKPFFTKYLPVEGEIKLNDFILWEKQTYASEERYKEYIGKVYKLGEPTGLGLGMIVLEDFYPKKSLDEVRESIIAFMKRHGKERTPEQIEENAIRNQKTSGYLHLKVGYNIFEKDVKKVKLFLCSRDIAVGDTVVWLHKYTWSMFQEFPVTTQEGVDIMKKDHAGKWGVKIGEISPEATWVKEDMEFNEEDIHKACYHPEHRVVDQWDISDEEWADWKPNNRCLKCWMIKCSQCGHYH